MSMATGVILAAAAAQTASGLSVAVAATSPANQYVNAYVGSDTGSGSATDPLRTIQAAMNRARPGTIIHLAAGTYRENVVTRVDGLPSARIIIQGPATGTAKLFGTSHVVEIRNSYYTLQNFSIDGQEGVEGRQAPSTWPRDISGIAAFDASIASIVVNDRLVYIDSGSSTTGVKGTIIDHMTLTGAGGECVRIRGNASGNIVENSLIQYCGMYPIPQDGVATYHNGEGVYIGTSLKSTNLAFSWDDQSWGNVVTGDTIRTFGSECFDVKENSHNNTLSHTRCADNNESTQHGGSNVELRGYANTIEYDSIFNSSGYGIKISSDSASEDLGHNNIISNHFADQSGGALSDTSTAHSGITCGNVTLSGSAPGDFSRLPGWSSPCG
jgi:Protein of unknown function (DUF1565)